MKLFTKYNRINAVILVAFSLLSGLTYYFLMNYLLLRELDQNLSKIEKRIRSYAELYKTFPREPSVDDLWINYTPINRAGEFREFKLLDPIAMAETHPHRVRELDFSMELNHKWYKVSVSRTLEGTNSLAKLVMKAAAIAILVVIAVTLLVHRVVFRRLWQPFYVSINALHNFQLGKQRLPSFPTTSIDEFNFMNANLEKMAERVEKEYLVLKEFAENASHEMQTPLAIIRSKLDLAIQEEHLSEKQSAILKSAYTSIKKLANLNRSLLLIVKIENNQFAECISINLKNKLEDKILQFRDLWKNKIAITCQLADATIFANSDLVDLLLNNLFNNAIKHNIPNGRVLITLDRNSLSVRNTGNPLPLDETRLFKRFYRGSADSEHNGLGLSIVKQICEISGITVSYSFSDTMHAFTLRWS